MYIWPNGKQYEGEWHLGKMHGQGSLILPNGKKYEGYFENNEFMWH